MTHRLVLALGEARRDPLAVAGRAVCLHDAAVRWIIGTLRGLGRSAGVLWMGNVPSLMIQVCDAASPGLANERKNY